MDLGFEGLHQRSIMAKQWILDLTKQLQLPDSPPSPDQELSPISIYRVPKMLRDVNSQAYEPKIASFGPYHHDSFRLRAMEQHKERALIHFLRRIAKSSKTPEDVLAAIREVEPRLLASYDGVQIVCQNEEVCLEQSRFGGRDWAQEKDEFLKLMIVDGCFALEIMLAEKRSAAGEKSEYNSLDPVFGAERKKCVIQDLKRDMLLLENQIPLLALYTLAAIDGSGIGDVNSLIKAFYNLPSASPNDGLIDESLKKPSEQRGKVSYNLPSASSDLCSKVSYNLPSASPNLCNKVSYNLPSASPDDWLIVEGLKPAEQNFLHILNLCRKILTAEGEYFPSNKINVNSATKLRNAGVSFRKSKSKSFREISFNDGVLSLPSLEIDDTTESLLLNFMAFERLHMTAYNEVTAYVLFIDGLIKTTKDVALLRAEEIIMGCVGCDKNIASMFNKITEGAMLKMVFRDDETDDMNCKLNRYCARRINRGRASIVTQTLLRKFCIC